MADSVNAERIRKRATLKEHVLVMHDGRWSGKHDGNGIKTHFIPTETCAGGEGPGSAYDVAAFLFVYGAIGTAEVGSATGFHFDKDDTIAMAGHNVDFGVTPAWTVVSRQDHEATTFQVSMSKIFASLAERRLRSKQLAFAELPRRVAQLPEYLPGRKSPQ